MAITKTNVFAVAFVVAIVLSLGFVAMAAAPAHACGIFDNWNCGGGSSNDDSCDCTTITVTNDNSADVTNTVTVDAKTGHNDADGGNGDDGGNGGDTSGSGNAGKGGNGGNGGYGYVQTGNATAGAFVSNDVNKNYTDIDLCGCSGIKIKSIDVDSGNNHANVTNTVTVDAKTGHNDADGGNGDDGGNGGDVKSSHHKSFWWTPSTSGNGGAGGNGGNGGPADVITGHADSHAFVANVVNRNITRIK